MACGMSRQSWCQAPPRFSLLLFLSLASDVVRLTTAQIVLQRYVDVNCTQLSSGEGTQQSWQRGGPPGEACYNVNAGLHCNFRCNLKMACDYGTGSGITLEEYSNPSCLGTGQNKRSFAQHLNWQQGKAFLQGACTPEGPGKTTYLKFNKPIETYPDCSSYGAAAAASGALEVSYEGSYYMQFYIDNLCTQEFVPNPKSPQTYSRMQWKIQRGAKHCFDYLDATPRGNNSARDLGVGTKNFKMICGNSDGWGNGIMTRKFQGAACTGTGTNPEEWAATFYQMNKLAIKDLFKAKCVKWGSLWVKMHKPWKTTHFPDCESFACKTGFCSGGRLQNEFQGATPYVGNVRIVETKAQALPSSAFRQDRGFLAVSFTLVLLSALF
eukprot:TRINITY_DN111630_c0_g1_i1.p1 TRINITY_DN111630_c0_g1~~TRINITY_DN111630_c0_g1_i1.p1  ORF type:complete len:406 (-),score=57.33 TRINITY_DN111630_c0_g1_i1:79-1221(-)